MLDGIRVLIVDDQEDNLFLLSEYFRLTNSKVETANSGSDALLKLEIKIFDVVIMDLQMPLMDGWQTARTMREHGFLGKIIACSAVVTKPTDFQKKNQDFDGFIPKPVLKNQFLDYLSENCF